MEQPLLLPKLRTALSCLYGNANTSISLHNRHEAHAFLLNFKSSNHRRKVVSRIQSEKDRIKSTSLAQEQSQITLDDDGNNTTIGSIFLSCLALILQRNNNHEMIFAAQTLNHRTRSLKLVETLDLEAEDGLECGVARLALALEEIRVERARLQKDAAAAVVGNDTNHQLYFEQRSAELGRKSNAVFTAWLERYVSMLVHRCDGTGGGDIEVSGDGISHTSMPARDCGSFCTGGELLAMVLQRHSSTLLSNDANHGIAMMNDESEKREEKIKGTLIMLTLTVAMYASAFAEYEEEHWHHHSTQQPVARSSWANAVLSELGSALSITSLRIRYKPVTNNLATPTPEPSCPPLIDTLINTLKLVEESAEVYFSWKTQNHQMNTDPSFHTAIHEAHQYAIQRSIAACIKALPETVLLPPGQEDTGHRIPSVDRACLRAASIELRSVGTSCFDDNVDNITIGTGMDKAWKELIDSHRGRLSEGQIIQADTSVTQLLECCEAWARYVAVPIHVVNMTVCSLTVGYLQVSRSSTSSHHQEKAQMAAFQYLVSLFESASPSLTQGEILAASLGVATSGNRGKGGGGSSGKNTNTRKKQGNKSKKRQEERLGQAIAVQDSGQDYDAADAAENELLARRNAACVAAAAVFGVSIGNASVLDDDWGLRLAVTSPCTSTHGICSTVAAAANSVLPHLLDLERGDVTRDPKHEWRLELFSAIVAVICRMCASSSREVRVLAYEPLMTMHSTLNSVAAVSLPMEELAVQSICECVLFLANACGYPDGYFDCLSENSDEDTEIERNDIRDVVRTVCGLDFESLGVNKESSSLLILERTIIACHSSVRDAASSGHLPRETAVHILSALAKPLNVLGKSYKQQPSPFRCRILTMTMITLSEVCDQLNASLDLRPLSQIFPLSRLALMGIASLSPMLSSIAELKRTNSATETENELFHTLNSALKSALQHTLLSTGAIPELMAESTLKSTRYDIKGAMRGAGTYNYLLPIVCYHRNIFFHEKYAIMAQFTSILSGGEDHVGCIALLRLSHESDCLTDSILEVCGPTILHDLASLHQVLKVAENNRGFGVDYGTGVCPVSRRIILRVISTLALYDMKQAKDGAIAGRDVLHKLAIAPIDDLRLQKDVVQSAEKLFRICECAYDFAFFSPELVTDLLNKHHSEFQLLFECVISGYSRLSFNIDVDDICYQWGRLRGGACAVLRTSIKDTITDFTATIISSLVTAECQAATIQCNHGPGTDSNIFNENIIGEEMVGAGVYLILIKECLDRVKKANESSQKNASDCRQCLSILKQVSTSVTQLLLHQSPEAISHLDPRPTIAEAWFLALIGLVSICRNNELIASTLANDGVENFFGESLSLAAALVFLKDIGTKSDQATLTQSGMSLDGPQTLAIETFLAVSLLLGPSILSAGVTRIAAAIHVQEIVYDKKILGSAILVAAFLRSVSGALPPWIVEDIPDVFHSMYIAMGSNVDEFIQMLRASTKLKASLSFSGVRSGELLAGRYLDARDSHIEGFLSQTKEVCIKGNWNKLKIILKATCGGKKKDSGFNLKPQYTTWDCDRM